MSLHPDSDQEEIIARLRAESAIDRDLLNQIRRVLSEDSEFEGLSLVGGVRAILRRYREEKERNFKLEKELSRAIKR
jgi:hypothetical protein